MRAIFPSARHARALPHAIPFVRLGSLSIPAPRRYHLIIDVANISPLYRISCFTARASKRAYIKRTSDSKSDCTKPSSTYTLRQSPDEIFNTAYHKPSPG